MSKAGQRTFKGINAQAKAAFLLFLDRLKDPEFTHIHLEAADWEDFNLHFKNKKIVCEAKNHKKKLSFGDLKSILKTIASRQALDAEDEITIACAGVGPQLRKAFDELNGWMGSHPKTRKPFTKRGFRKAELELLLRTSFFEFNPKTLSREIAELLYQQLQFWVPSHEITALRDSLLVNYVYENSAIGQEFTRQELLQKIDEFGQEKIRESALYDDGRRKMEAQLSTLIEAVEKEDFAYLTGGQLIALTAQPTKMTFMLAKVEAHLKNSILEKWDFLWEGLLKGWYIFKLFRILEAHLDSERDARYVLNFLCKNFLGLNTNARQGWCQESAVEIADEILTRHPKLSPEIFSFVDMVLQVPDVRRLERSHYRERKEMRQLSELVEKLFSVGTKSDDFVLQDRVLSLIVSHFDLIHGDNMFSAPSQKSVFDVLRTFISRDFDENLPKAIGYITQQFAQSRGGKFSGWEGIGPGVSMSNGRYSINDFHFVGLVLEPAIKEFYDQSSNKDQAWKKIKILCLTRKENEVSASRPDFLNRAIIDVLFDRLQSSNLAIAKEAQAILLDFISMRRGIPHKEELIFARLVSTTIEVQQKWAFIKVHLNAEWNKKQLPESPFIEQMVAEMAISGFVPAIKTITSWFKKDEYTGGSRITGYLGIQNIQRLISSETERSRLLGIKLFRSYVQSVGFTGKLERFDTFDVANLLARIISLNYEVGIGIWKSVAKSEHLTMNQQLLLTSSINRFEEKDPAQLMRVFKDLLEPFLRSLGNRIENIVKKLDHAYAREAIVEFAHKLAKAGLFSEALGLVQIFKDDPSPEIENDTDDPTGEHNYHVRLIRGEDVRTINTVRGWVGWVLHGFCVLDARNHIPEVFKLTKELVKDQNYFVRYYAICILIELARIRHTVMPHDKNERFLDVRLATNIEKLAFDLLADKENQGVKALMTSLARAFNNIRTLTTEQALRMLTSFRDSSFDEVVIEMAPLFIFFSEFRETAFSEPKWSHLGSFDSRPTKKLLIELLHSDSKDIRRRFAWQFWRLLDEAAPAGAVVPGAMSYDEAFNIAIRYLKILAEKYDPETYGSIYYFVEAAMDVYFDDCLELYIACVRNERTALEKEPFHVTWLSHSHRDILEKVAVKGDDTTFLDLLTEISSYRTYMWEDLHAVVKRLSKFPKSEARVGGIFDNLIERSPAYFEYKKIWLGETPD